MDAAAMAGFARRWRLGAWTVAGALYGRRAEVRLRKRALRAGLKGLSGRLNFVSDRRIGALARLERLPGAPGAKLSQVRRTLESVHGLMQGVPSSHFLPGAYWRKRTPPSPDCDLDRDGCGLIWCSFVAPIDGALAREMVDIATEVLLAHGFEPGITLTLVNERTLDSVVSITYDRDEPGADERALACRDTLYRRLMARGFYPYRLDVRATDLMPAGNPDYGSFLQDLRRIADPDRVLAPGRYEF